MSNSAKSLLQNEEDTVWASFNTGLSCDNLKSFCADIERMLRINPMLEFSKWNEIGNNHYSFSGRNISQEEAFDFDVELTTEKTTNGFLIHYKNSLKTNTSLEIEPAEQGSKLTIIDSYAGTPKPEREARLAEVDRSIVVWAEYLQKYILSWQRWSRFSFWRWYMRKIWQPMKPSGRRITYMLLIISLFEIALITLGVIICNIEY